MSWPVAVNTLNYEWELFIMNGDIESNNVLDKDFPRHS